MSSEISGQVEAVLQEHLDKKPVERMRRAAAKEALAERVKWVGEIEQLRAEEKSIVDGLLIAYELGCR